MKKKRAAILTTPTGCWIEIGMKHKAGAGSADHRFCGPRLFGPVMERSNSRARIGGHSAIKPQRLFCSSTPMPAYSLRTSASARGERAKPSAGWRRPFFSGLRQPGGAVSAIMAPANGHAGTTYGNLSSRWCLAMDGFSPEGTAVPETRDSITSGALSAIGRPLRVAKPYVAGVPTT